ncbi:MAG: dihydrodipicolinate synthase family protein [Bryobacterales bacterium]|nr:dihydrodipicolinate synthase family protein [Bryobacterales bacterium]
MELSHPLSGITVPMVTPLSNAGRLDPEGLDRLTEHVIQGGAQGLFVLGTTGEGPSLSGKVQREVVQRVCQASSGRAQVLVGITHPCAEDALALAEFSAAAGAQAVVYAGPSYFPVAQPELLRHVARIVEASPLPLFLYNMPSHTGVVFEPDTVRQLMEIPGVAGLKDSSGNLMYFQRICRLREKRPDFAVLMGPEELMVPAMSAGATGGVNGGANMFPSLYVSLYQACASGNISEARRLQQAVLDVSEGIYSAGTYASSYLKGLKYALSLLGICMDAMAEPYSPFEAEHRERVARALVELQARHALAA